MYKNRYNILLFFINFILCILVLYLGMLGVFNRSTAYVYQTKLEYFHGVVVNEEKVPVKDVRISLSSNKDDFTLTNSLGEFVLKDTLLDVYILGKLVFEKGKKKSKYLFMKKIGIITL